MNKIEVTLKREDLVKKIYFDDMNSAQVFCEQYEDENPPFAEGVPSYSLSIISMDVKNALKRFCGIKF